MADVEAPVEEAAADKRRAPLATCKDPVQPAKKDTKAPKAASTSMEKDPAPPKKPKLAPTPPPVEER